MYICMWYAVGLAYIYAVCVLCVCVLCCYDERNIGACVGCSGLGYAARTNENVLASRSHTSE